MRAGIPTASEFGNLITDKFAIRKGEMVESYISRKLAEAWVGGALPGFNTYDLEQGQIREKYAIPYYEIMFGEEVKKVGLITNDSKTVGASLDGLIGESLGLEVKCLQMQNHVKLLTSGQMPEEYGPQVQGGMWVTGFKMWKFMAYCPGFPAFVTVIERDEEAQSAISTALAAFQVRFEAGMDKLIALNGGERPKPNAFREAVMRETKPDIADYRH